MKVVLMTDTPYNQSKRVVGKLGSVQYDGAVVGTLVLSQDGVWLYYFKGQEQFLEIAEREE